MRNEIERSSLISVLTTPLVIDEYDLKPEDFTTPLYQKTFAAIMQLIDDEQVVTFSKILVTAEIDLTKADPLAKIVNEAKQGGDVLGAKFYLPKLKELTQQRKISGIIAQYQMGEIDIQEMQDGIDIVRSAEVGDNERRMTYAEGVSLKFREMSEKDDKKHLLSTGFKDLDLLIGGIKPRGKLIVIAARPSVGKTAFVQQLVEQLTTENEGTTGTLFNMEMDNSSMMDRTVARTAKIDSNKLRFITQLDLEEMNRFSDRAQLMADIPVVMYEADGDSVLDIRRKVKNELRTNPSRHHIVVVDHLGLIKKHTNEGRHDLDIGAMTWSLKMMAKQLGVTVLLLSQLSRKVEDRQDKRPVMSDLRDSGNIEQDADAVWFLYRDDYYNAETEDANTIEVIVAKNRDGNRGTVKLAFRKEFSHILSLSASASYSPPV